MLLEKGIHPSLISESFEIALEHSLKILRDISTPVDLDDKQTLIQCVNTTLSSKVVGSYSDVLSPIAVDAVLKIADKTKSFVDLRDIKMVKKVGGTIEETELFNGLIFTGNKISH